MFKISKINKSSYYKWLSNIEKQINREQKENKIIESIKELYIKHKGRYGVERMTNALKIEKNINCNHKKVYRIMRENGYLSLKNQKKISKKKNQSQR